jgi:uncharacterized protein (DUF433 family)
MDIKTRKRFEMIVQGDEDSLSLIAQKHSNGVGPAIPAGVRIPVASILDRLAAGESIAKIVDETGLSPDQVRDAIQYAAARIAREERMQRPRKTGPLMKIVGPWPGDETDEDLLAALKAMG